jgi:hypothetical protein
MEPNFACTESPSRRTFRSEEFCNVNVPLGVTSLNWLRFVSLIGLPPNR